MKKIEFKDYHNRPIKNAGFYSPRVDGDIREIYQVFLGKNYINTLEIITSIYRKYSENDSSSVACRLIRITRRDIKKIAIKLRKAAQSLEETL
ncbi:MAG: hypothetical protein AABY00_01305 [Nanoarchaeota archaeon]